MRPPEFTGGNPVSHPFSLFLAAAASMRPPEFTGGNAKETALEQNESASGFNEAAGIHRRKRGLTRDVGAGEDFLASMRPPEFTGGNGPQLTPGDSYSC